MNRTMEFRVRWLVYAAAVAVAGLAVLGGGCPPTSTGDANNPSGSTGDANNPTSGSSDANNPSGSTGDANTPSGNTGDANNPSGNTGDANNPSGNTGDANNPSGDTGGSGDANNPSGNTGDANNPSGNTGGTGNTGPTAPPNAIALKKIVQTGDAVPGQPAAVTFKELGTPVIDAEGRIAFWGLYQGTGARGYGGLYVYDANAVNRVLDDDPNTAGVVPDREGRLAYFGRYGGSGGSSPLNTDLAWGAGDRLLFISFTYGLNVLDDSMGIYRWRATDGGIVRVADREQVSTALGDVAPGTLIPTYVQPGVSDDGIAVFGLTYGYFTQGGGATWVSGMGVFTSNGTSVSILADTRRSLANPGTVPGQGATAYFTNIDPLTTLSPAGDMLFEAQYSGGDGTQGVYLNRGGTSYYVIDNRAAANWPGLPSGAQFRTGAGVRVGMGPARHIAVDARLFATALRDTVLLWDFGPGTWAELTGPSSTPATALLSGVSSNGSVLLLSNANPYIVNRNGRTQVNAVLPAELQGATLVWSDATGSINAHDRAAVQYAHQGGAQGLALWTGQKLLVVADVALGVPAGASSIVTVTEPRRDRPGRSGMLNDGDELTFRVVRTNNSQAIYAAQAQ